MQIHKLLFLILLILVIPKVASAALDPAGPRRSQGSGGGNLWWPSLQNLPYTINFYTFSWPRDTDDNSHTSLDDQCEFEDAIDSAFGIWQATGQVSFAKQAPSANKNPNFSSCSSLTESACEEGAQCVWGYYLDPKRCINYSNSEGFHDGKVNFISNVKEESFWAGTTGTIAVTSVWYSTTTNQIFEADIAINNAYHEFDGDDSTTHFNLSAILAHEIGHFIGIAHPCTVSGSDENLIWEACTGGGGDPYINDTMYPYASTDDDTKLLVLTANDLTALGLICDSGDTICHGAGASSSALDPQKYCYDKDAYGEVDVKQGFGCFFVDTDKNTPQDQAFYY